MPKEEINKNMNLELTMELPLSVKKEENQYVSSCPVLDVHSQGDTKKEAVNNLSEAVTLFITTCLEMGTLEQVLKECGFQVARPISKRNKKVSSPTFNVNIPLSIPNNTVCA